jgi:hypothetical protein
VSALVVRPKALTVSEASGQLQGTGVIFIVRPGCPLALSSRQGSRGRWGARHPRPFADRQQRGRLVAGRGRIPRLPDIGAIVLSTLGGRYCR